MSNIHTPLATEQPKQQMSKDNIIWFLKYIQDKAIKEFKAKMEELTKDLDIISNRETINNLRLDLDSMLPSFSSPASLNIFFEGEMRAVYTIITDLESFEDFSIFSFQSYLSGKIKDYTYYLPEQITALSLQDYAFSEGRLKIATQLQDDIASYS